MKAKDYFHLAPQNWNCAQAIQKSVQPITGLNDEDIELQYRPMGGGACSSRHVWGYLLCKKACRRG